MGMKKIYKNYIFLFVFAKETSHALFVTYFLIEICAFMCLQHNSISTKRVKTSVKVKEMFPTHEFSFIHFWEEKAMKNVNICFEFLHEDIKSF